MRTIAVVLSILISFSLVKGQPPIENRLLEPIENCEIVAYNSQHLISKMEYYEKEEIKLILDQWEAVCGKSEPSQRVRIILDIFSQTFDFENYAKNFEGTFHAYKMRINASKNSNRDLTNEFQRFKGLYNYVPINESFDQWTKTFASLIIDSQDQPSDEYLICLLFMDDLETFYALLSDTKYSDSNLQFINRPYYHNPYSNYPFIKIYAGAQFNGQSNPDNPFDIRLGASMMMPLKDTWDLEIGMAFNIHQTLDTLVVNFEGIDSTTLSRSNHEFFFALHKSFSLDQEESTYLNPFVGLGVSMMGNKLKKPSESNNTSEEHFEVGAVAFSTGINFEQKIGKKQIIGVNFTYHYNPYHWHDKLVSDISPNAFSTGIYFRF